MRHQAKIVNVESHDSTILMEREITIRLGMEEYEESSRAPFHAYINHTYNFLSLEDHQRTNASCHQLEPEGVAMQLLRLAWVAAHTEKREKELRERRAQ